MSPRRRLVTAALALSALLVVTGVVAVVRRGDPPPADLAASAAPSTEPAPPTTEPSTSTSAEPSTTTVAPAPAPSPAPTTGAAAADRRARLAAVRSWTFPLGADLQSRPVAKVAADLRGFDLVVIDGQDAPAGLVQAVKGQGSIVLGYVNVGAIEAGRPWTAAAQAYKLDYWEQWDEWYADVSQAGFRRLVTDTIVPPMLAKGFDGLFLDNVDMVDTHPAQRAAMVQLVSQLSATVRARGGYLFAQNGEDGTVDAIAPHLDGWNREDVSYTYDDGYTATDTRDRQAALSTVRRLRARGLLVTTIDYLDRFDGPEAEAAVRAACQAGAVPSVGDINLTRIFPARRCS